MVAARNIKEHPYSVSSQLSKTKIPNSKDIIRFKPSAVPRKQIFPDEKQASNSIRTRNGKENIGHQGSSNYDYHAYLDKPSIFSNLSKINRQILVNLSLKLKAIASKRGILKNRTTNPTTSTVNDNLKWVKENAANSTNIDSKRREDDQKLLKFFSGTTKSVIFLTKQFNEDLKRPNLKRAHVGNYIFEMIGKLFLKKNLINIEK